VTARAGPSPLLRKALVFAALFGVLFACASYDLVAGRGLVPTLPRATNGDEPHYLVILNSILGDRDLELADNYRRATLGGFDAGARFRGVPFDHHAMLVDERGVSREWHELYDWRRPIVCDAPGCVGFAAQPGLELEQHHYREAPAHPPAFAAILALPLVLLRPSTEDVEPLAGYLLVLLAWLATLFTYRAARALGLDERHALAAAALLALASPWLWYARSFFSETMSGTLLVLAWWALRRDRPSLAAAALVPAIWIKPLFAVVGVAWVLTRLLQRRRGDAARLALIVGAGCALLVAFDEHLARVPLLPPAYLHDPRQLPFRWFWATLLGGAHGLVWFVPWLVPVAVVLYARRRERALPLGELAAPLGLALVVIAYQQGPHHCWGPRYWVPFLPWLAVAAAAAMQLGGRRVTAIIVGLALVTAAFTLPATLRFRDESLWEQPPERALLHR
jgi:hypothetical protein